MKRIFIIEDDPNLLYGMRDIFSSNDYEVEMSDSSEGVSELLKRLKLFKPDIVILDMILPKIDGGELIREIKEDDSINKTEIFIFTDLSDGDGQARSVGLGANYYFMKNEFDVYSFTNKVMRIMERGDKTFQDSDNIEDAEDLVMD